ncbi:MAG: nucleoside deaminase [Candidatus Dependentiae bacterium]|nr:nucleoside deaminase [Candidatus Dependentiae bacterium]
MKPKETIFGHDRDVVFMSQALRQAEKAFAKNEVPVGAVIVNPQGVIIARGMNLVESQHTQRAHAESLAIEKAGKKLHDWRLEGCWLYVTLEPCAMCMNLILLSRLDGVVFGASSPLFGYHLDNNLNVQLYKKSVLSIVEGICQEEAGILLKRFFKTKR